MSVGSSTPLNTTPSDSIQFGALSASETKEFLKLMADHFGLSQDKALALLEKMGPEQARTYLQLATGEKSISRADAKEMWNLSESELDTLFGGNKQIGVFGNPFGDVFLRFLMLSYSMGLDIKKLMGDVLNVRYDTAIQAAADRLEGATTKFACAMAAAALTVAFAGASYYKVRNYDGKDAMDPKWQWFGPMTASLFSAPITAGGDYADAMSQYDASLLDADSQYLDSVYQQLTQLYQGIRDTDGTTNSGL